MMDKVAQALRQAIRRLQLNGRNARRESSVAGWDGSALARGR